MLPGDVATASATITGINYKSVIRGTNNIQISIDGGPFISSPQLIRNNQTATLRYQTDSTGTDSDFNKTFTTTITIGKRSTPWVVTTKVKDNNPTPFTFTPVEQAEVSTLYESNIVNINGLEANYTTFAFISNGNATFSVNGGPYVNNAFVNNGDNIRLRLTSSASYDTSVSSQITVGDYSTSYSIRTRVVDVTINPFTFTNVTNADLGNDYISNTITVSGADNNIPLTARISPPGLISVNSSSTFFRDLVTVFNGDTIRIRIPGSAITEYSKTTSATLNVSGTTGTYSVTTRPRPVKTIPDPFSFTNVTGSSFQVLTESNIITLTGMSPGDFGTASITGSGGNGSPAQFKVIRGSSTAVSGNTIPVATTYRGITVRGFLYYPTSDFLGSNLDVLILFHPTIETNGVTPTIASQDFLNTVLNNIQIKDKIIFSVAYPQDAIPGWSPAQEFPELNLANFYLGDNIQYAETAFLWVKNELNSYFTTNGISRTIKKIFAFGHSQGGYLVHRLNTMQQMDGVIANAPGPIDLIPRCSNSESNGDNNVSCRRIKNTFGTTNINPEAYNTRSLKNFLTGTRSPALFTQALDDQTGVGSGSPQVPNMTNILEPGLNACTNCQSITFKYYDTGGHDAFRVNATLQQDIRNFVSSTVYSTSPGSVVRDYSSAPFQVTNGDRIQLRMVSGGESVNVQSTFTVSGTDTTNNISGVPGSRSASWSIQSRSLVCIASNFSSSLASVTTDIPNELRNVSFTISGLNDGCDNVVTTSDGNSYLRVNGSQGSSLTVKNGDVVQVYMTSPVGGSTRTTTVTVRRPSGANAVSSNWSITTTPPPEKPVVTLSLSPTSIFEGEFSTLSWTSAYATSVVSSNFNASSLSGSTIVRPTSTTTYTITVSGPGGQTTATATLTVGIKPPTVAISVFPTSIKVGESATLSWNTTNAESIISSNFGAVSLSGSIPVRPTSSEQYTLIVSGRGGQATGNASLTVVSTPPTVTISASPTSVANNGSTTLTWSSTDATSVSSSNFGAASVNGSITLYNLTSSRTYTITVTGPGGQATATVNVNVQTCTPATSSTAFENYKQGIIVYGNGFRQTIDLYRSSKSSAYSTPLPNKPSFTYGQVQDSISSFYRGTLGRPADDGAISATSTSWVTVFNARSDLRTLSDLNSQIFATYNADPPSGSGEATLVRTRGGRSRIEDSCGNIWTP